MTDPKWDTIFSECRWDEPHLFRYEPDIATGGSYLRDQSGRKWCLRTCAICGLREKCLVEEPKR